RYDRVFTQTRRAVSQDTARCAKLAERRKLALGAGVALPPHMTTSLGFKLGWIMSFAICTGCNGVPAAQPAPAVSAMAVSATAAPLASEAVAVRVDAPRVTTT